MSEYYTLRIKNRKTVACWTMPFDTQILLGILSGNLQTEMCWHIIFVYKSYIPGFPHSLGIIK